RNGAGVTGPTGRAEAWALTAWNPQERAVPDRRLVRGTSLPLTAEREIAKPRARAMGSAPTLRGLARLQERVVRDRRLAPLPALGPGEREIVEPRARATDSTTGFAGARRHRGASGRRAENQWGER